MGHNMYCDCKRCKRRRDRLEAEAHQESQDEGSRVSGITEALVSGAITLAGAVSDPPQDSDTTRSNFLESSQQGASDRRSRDLDEGTRYHGRRDTSSY